jgi:hypothetical protein
MAVTSIFITMGIADLTQEAEYWGTLASPMSENENALI